MMSVRSWPSLAVCSLVVAAVVVEGVGVAHHQVEGVGVVHHQVEGVGVAHHQVEGVVVVVVGVALAQW